MGWYGSWDIKYNGNDSEKFANLAKLIIEQNAASVGYDVAQDAIDSINEDKKQRKSSKEKDKEGGTKEDGKEKTKRRRTTKSA